jgi:hypothetical protein
VYIAPDGTIESFIDGAKKIRADFKLLRKHFSGEEHALEKALLRKMPGTMADTVATYLEKIDKRESLDEPLKWTYNKLVQLLANEYIKAGAGLHVKSARSNGGKLCARCGSEEPSQVIRSPMASMCARRSATTAAAASASHARVSLARLASRPASAW